MNDQEFRIFFSRMQSIFPEIATFVTGLEDTQAQPVVNRYKACLRSIPLEMANNVLDDFSLQAESPWGGYGDKERAAAIIARECGRRLAAERERDATAKRLEGIRGGHRNIEPGIFGRILHAIRVDQRHDDKCRRHQADKGRCRRGCPVPQVVARELLGEESPQGPEPEHGCRWCTGDGLANVLDPVSITPDFLAGGPLTRNRQMVVACLCSEGRKRQAQTLPNSTVAYWQTLDHSRHIYTKNRPEHDMRIQCHAWIESAGGTRHEIFDAMNRNGGVA